VTWEDTWERPSTLEAEERFGDTVNLRQGELDSVPDFLPQAFSVTLDKSPNFPVLQFLGIGSG